MKLYIPKRKLRKMSRRTRKRLQNHLLVPASWCHGKDFWTPVGRVFRMASGGEYIMDRWGTIRRAKA